MNHTLIQKSVIRAIQLTVLHLTRLWIRSYGYGKGKVCKIVEYVLPHISGKFLAYMVNARFAPCFLVAVKISAHELKLLEYIKYCRNCLVLPLAKYLDSANDLLSEKRSATAEIREELIKRNKFVEMKPKELRNASVFYQTMGFFELGTVFRYAAIEKTLNYTGLDEVTTNAIVAETYGIDQQSLDFYSEKYSFLLTNVALKVQQAIGKNKLEVIPMLERSGIKLAQNKIEATKNKQGRDLGFLWEKKLDVKGKNVLLIGPSKRESQPVSNSWPDLIMRIAYKGENTVAVDKEFETNISFYRNHKLENLSKTEIENIASELDFFLVTLPRRDLIEKVKRVRNLFISRFGGKILFDAHCNGGLEAVLFVIGAGAEHVYIKNMDLFVNNIYQDEYMVSHKHKFIKNMGGKSCEVESFCRSLASVHCPVAQYSIYKSLWNTARLSGDKTFEKIMTNGVANYVNLLDSTYFPFKIKS